MTNHTETTMPIVRDSQSGNGQAPEADRITALELKVEALEAVVNARADTVDAKLDAQSKDIALILGVVPTATEKRTALALGGVVMVILGALAKRYLGIEIPLSDAEITGGAVALAALGSTMLGLRKRAGKEAAK